MGKSCHLPCGPSPSSAPQDFSVVLITQATDPAQGWPEGEHEGGMEEGARTPGRAGVSLNLNERWQGAQDGGTHRSPWGTRVPGKRPGSHSLTFSGLWAERQPAPHFLHQPLC